MADFIIQSGSRITVRSNGAYSVQIGTVELTLVVDVAVDSAPDAADVEVVEDDGTVARVDLLPSSVLALTGTMPTLRRVRSRSDEPDLLPDVEGRPRG